MTEVLSYWNHSIDLQSKSIDWVIYEWQLRHERVKNRKAMLSLTLEDTLRFNVKAERFYRAFKFNNDLLLKQIIAL